MLPFAQQAQFFHKRARKKLDNNELLDALVYCRRALEHDPQNVTYRLDMAELYTEIGRFEKSNAMLLRLLDEDESLAPDCLFGLACNYMGMQEYERAQPCLGKYLALAPQGDYAADAADMLDVIAAQLAWEEESRQEEGITYEQDQRIEAGRLALDCGDYEEAVRILQDVCTEVPAVPFVRNNLALACFYSGDRDRALALAEATYAREKNDVHAICNLALFYHADGRTKEAERMLTKLNAAEPDDLNELYAMSNVFCELGEHARACNVMEEIAVSQPYETRLLHYLALAYCRVGRQKDAVACWDTLLKVDPEDTIAPYYRRVAQEVLRGERIQPDWQYVYQVPYEELLERLKAIHTALSRPLPRLVEEWQKGGSIVSLVRWGLELNDPAIKRALLHLLTVLRDDTAQQMLHDFLLRPDERDAVKHDALTLMGQAHINGPFYISIAGNVVRAQINVLDTATLTQRSESREALRLAMMRMQETYGADCAEFILLLWRRLLPRMDSMLVTRAFAPAWAAVIEWQYAQKEGLPLTRSELARAYGISLSTLNRYLLRAARQLEGDIQHE